MEKRPKGQGTASNQMLHVKGETLAASKECIVELRIKAVQAQEQKRQGDKKGHLPDIQKDGYYWNGGGGPPSLCLIDRSTTKPVKASESMPKLTRLSDGNML